jgi:hypothetical protein
MKAVTLQRKKSRFDSVSVRYVGFVGTRPAFDPAGSHAAHRLSLPRTGRSKGNNSS